jgi:hypothetical protein
VIIYSYRENISFLLELAGILAICEEKQNNSLKIALGVEEKIVKEAVAS